MPRSQYRLQNRRVSTFRPPTFATVGLTTALSSKLQSAVVIDCGHRTLKGCNFLLFQCIPCARCRGNERCPLAAPLVRASHLMLVLLPNSLSSASPLPRKRRKCEFVESKLIARGFSIFRPIRCPTSLKFISRSGARMALTLKASRRSQSSNAASAFQGQF